MVERQPSPSSILATQTGFLLSQLGFHSAARFTERLATLGLQPRHYGMLVHLAEAGGLTQQQLADRLALHRNVMVGLVDELERSGLVERRRHPDDRRAYALHLTKRAKTILPRAQRLADEHNTELLAPLSEEQQKETLALLELVADGAGLGRGVHPGLQT